MAKQYGHQPDRNGRPVVAAIPKQLRGYDPDWDVHTFTEGPIKRLLGALGTKRTKR
ncbi:hypothetical protein J2S43_006817 [Catenuloplanes nepalensis]|uniref:Uncharacterized protein n=1 Tax=Catenuloplanes nepalensis TaxID=587533 RepID=A0ABT9N3M4_9ACTN|nr:hypothetical protein [Catenuloplanes nepalensis]MDP9798305.1 hypothetical protein [Catenuloplanes nepalensis]